MTGDARSPLWHKAGFPRIRNSTGKYVKDATMKWASWRLLL